MTSFSLLKVILKGRAIRRKLPAYLLTTSFVVLLLVGIGVLEYLGFRSFFHALTDFPDIKPIIIAYSLEGLFLFLFGVILVSILISGPFIYLNKKDTNFLLPLPIKNLTLFWAHFYEQIIFILWIALIFGIPAILSLLTLKSSVFLLCDGIIMFMFLIILSVTIGNILLLMIMSLTRKIAPRLNYFFIFILVIGLGFLLVRQVLPKEIFDLLAANNPQGNPEAFANIASHYRFWPSGWFTGNLLADLGYTQASILSHFYLIFAVILAFIIQGLLAKKFYRKILISSQENLAKISSSAHKQKSQLASLSGWSLLITKEWVNVFRNRKDLGQFVFFVFLLGIYLSFIFSSKVINSQTDPVWTPRIISFIILTLCYFITLLALRFVFPLSSIERQKSWFFVTLPKVYQNEYSARVYAWLLPTTLLIEIIVLLTALGFNLSWGFILPLMILAPFIILFILALANTIGTLYPMAESDNPEELSTTAQGLSLFILISLYTLAVIWLLSSEVKTALAAGYVGISIGLNYWLIILISICLTIIAWYFGNKKHQKMYLG